MSSVDSITSRLGGIKITTPIDSFFASYPSFPYDPLRPAAAEFQRLRKHQKWAGNSKEANDARQRFHVAFEAEFNSTFGEVTDWRRLCDVLGVVPVPDSLTKAKKALAPINVNIFDLLQHERAVQRGEKVQLMKFPDVRALAKYSKKHKKIYPKARAKQQGAVRFMLRGLFSV
ncbi:hypothetical protein K440DRAFT_663562 [Wilcoxina mikolae CBS 423.85]|nr:hypothetical protein K440DRAFT_663562 [Wilcoxina mikolae CBS 423.85]